MLATALLNTTAAQSKRAWKAALRSGAGWFEHGKAGKRGRELLPAGRQQAHDRIRRGQHYRRMLGGNVGETVPAVARQLLFWRIRRRVRAVVRHHDRGTGFGKRRPTPGA